MSNRPMRCLVTGGAGFGGSHLVAALVERGAHVTVLDRTPVHEGLAGELGISHLVDPVQADICDVPRLTEIMRSNRINVVFHLAADPIVADGVKRPEAMLDANVRGTYSVLEACRQSDPMPDVVFASSGAYYGDPSTHTAIPEEQTPGVHASLYGPSKVAGEALMLGYANTFGIRHVVCRFTNTYGPGDRHLSRLVPRAMHLLSRGALYDFGDRDDGTTNLDFLYIGDMARAYVSAADYLITGGREHVFNFGTGSLTSVRDVARAVSRAYDGAERNPVFRGPSQNRFRPHKLLDTRRARTILGWEPATPLAEGLAITVAWHRQKAT